MPAAPDKVEFTDAADSPITSVSGGSSFNVVVTLDKVTTIALDVTLMLPTGSPVTLPITLTVPQGSQQGRATGSTSSVTSNQSVQVTASAGGGSANASILVMAGIVP